MGAVFGADEFEGIMSYAARTKVSVPQTRLDIENALRRHGAEAFGFSQDGERAVIAFRLKGFSYKFAMPVPEAQQAAQAKWRALLLAIRARLEGVAAGLETFEEAFLSKTVMAGGETIWERARPELDEARRLGTSPRALSLTGPSQ